MSAPLSGTGYLHPPKEYPIDEIKKLISYNPDSGRFTWLVNRRAVKDGDIAGSVNSKGYVCISVLGSSYLAHRMAWMFVHGYTPKEIDHVNGNRSDNRISNLRDSCRSENALNTAMSDRNSSGTKGVSYNKKYKLWQAYGSINGKGVSIGSFKKIEDAIEARKRFVIENYNSDFYREE